MSGPGVPGPGIVTIVVGLGFLALEFDWAERWLERVIIWGDRAAERAERTTTKQRIAAGMTRPPRRRSPSGRSATTSRSCQSCNNPGV